MKGERHEGDLDARARRTPLPHGCGAALSPEPVRSDGRARFGAGLSTSGGRRDALQPAHRLRARRREGAAYALAPRDGRCERRAARLRQRGPAPLAAARARGRDRDARRVHDQDAMTCPGERKLVETNPTRGDVWALGLGAISGLRSALALAAALGTAALLRARS